MYLVLGHVLNRARSLLYMYYAYVLIYEKPCS